MLLATMTSKAKRSFAMTGGESAKGYKSGRPMLWMKLFKATTNSECDPMTSSKVTGFEESQGLLRLSCGS